MSVPGSFKPVEWVFRRSRAVWVTTYSLDISLFSRWLLPELGAPPLQVTVLADRDRLAASLARVPPEQHDTFDRVNRRWLLRGVRAGSGRFHPKSYLSVGRHDARLLVGSGNVSRDGLGAGNELFVAFESSTDVGDAALSGWVRWMSRIVDATGDLSLRARFERLRELLPPLPDATAEGAAQLWHNLDESLLDQVGSQLPDERADVVAVTAPYYDEHAEALGTLLSRARPKHVKVYAAERTKVNGTSLGKALDELDASVEWLQYRPSQFVHAKLAAFVYGREAKVMSGSANLSRAALLSPVSGFGNVELAAWSTTSRDVALDLFEPEHLEVVAWAPEDLAALTYDADEDDELPALPVVLLRVEPDRSGRLRVWASPTPVEGWLVTDGRTSELVAADAAVAGTGTTEHQLGGRLVWLTDSDGTVVSNRVVVDDPDTLDKQERPGGSDAAASSPPEGMFASDLNSKFGQSLQWVHERLLMEPPESNAREATGASEPTADQAGDGEDEEDVDELWNRIEAEELARDPRSATSRTMWRNGGADDPMMLLLEMLRDQAGAADRDPTNVVFLPRPERVQPGDDPGLPTREWSPDAKVRVRARNVARRWIDRLGDSRLAAFDPLQPAKAFGEMVRLLWQWTEFVHHREPSCPFSFDDLDELTLRLAVRTFGDGTVPGWYQQLSDSLRIDLNTQMPADIPERFTLLAAWALRPGRQLRERRVAWQQPLSAALDADYINPTEGVADGLSEVSGAAVHVEVVYERVLGAIEFEDEQLWCERLADQLGVASVALAPPPSSRGVVHLQVVVDGVLDPRVDPRVPALLVAARRYKDAPGVAMWAADGSWRLSLSDTDPALLRVEHPAGPQLLETDQPLHLTAIKQLAEQQLSLVQAFAQAQAA